MSERWAVDFMTVQQVAEAAGVSVRRVQRLCQDGRLAAMKIGGIWLILEHSAYEWIRGYRKPGPKPKSMRGPDGEQLELHFNGEE